MVRTGPDQGYRQLAYLPGVPNIAMVNPARLVWGLRFGVQVVLDLLHWEDNELTRLQMIRHLDSIHKKIVPIRPNITYYNGVYI